MSFHSSYDFGYLLKISRADLPLEEQQFMRLLETYFPYIYDVKYMMTAVDGMHGGLSALGDTLQVERIGFMHQAGSDSFDNVTFFALVAKHFADSNEAPGPNETWTQVQVPRGIVRPGHQPHGPQECHLPERRALWN